MKNLIAIVVETVITGLFVFIAMLYHSIIIGYTLSILWEWFIVPILNCRSIGIVEAIGISLLFIYLRINYNESSADKRAKRKDKKEKLENFLNGIDTEEKDIWEEVTIFFLIPLFFSALTLLIGYFIHIFMGNISGFLKDPYNGSFSFIYINYQYYHQMDQHARQYASVHWYQFSLFLLLSHLIIYET